MSVQGQLPPLIPAAMPSTREAPGIGACRPEFLPEVLIIGEFPFPTGSAGANYVRGHCRALREAGVSVGLLPNQRAGQCEDLQSDGTYRFRGILYWSLCQSGSESRLKALVHGLIGKRDPRIDWLIHQILDGLKAIIVYAAWRGTVPLIMTLRRLCRRHRIRLLIYVTEWPALAQYRGSLRLLDAMDGEVQRRWVNPRLDGTICISTYLQHYYERRGCRTALLPPLLDLKDPVWAEFAAGRPELPYLPMRFLFSGAYGRDRHDIIIRGVRRLRERGGAIILEYLGATKENIAALPGVGRELVDSLGDAIRFHGRVPDSQVHALISRASFGVMLRNNARWSAACFPSKVPEFAALRVPMLCNLTSDLAHYLKDGENAIVVREVSVGAFCAALERALALNEEHYRSMTRAAGDMAEQFSGSRHADTYRKLLSES